MKIKLNFSLLLLFLLILGTACQQEPVVVEVTAVVEQQVEVEVTATPQPKPSDTAVIEPTETETPTVEPTATLLPLQATLQAMTNSAAVPTLDPSQVTPSIADDDYVGLINQACAIVQENYVRDNFNGADWPAVCEEYRAKAAEIDNQEAFWDLATDMIRELQDNHSRFVRPANFAQEFSLPQEGAGVPWPGLEIWPAREDENVLLWDVCDTGPAASAGLQRGDHVLAINGETLVPGENGFDSSEINQLLYSQETEATLTVQRGPDREPEDIHLTFGGASGCDGWIYGEISTSPHLGYIRIPNFEGDSSTNILQLINRMEEDSPLDGLLLDVRHNPGGNADQSLAIFTTGDFGTQGPLREDATRTIFRIRGPVKWNETTPVVLLTDGSSHSAAEYFATGLQQSGRAVLVGMPTAGNTEGIVGFNLDDGSLIRLAISTIVLPDGSLLEGVGVQPDVMVPLGDWGLREVPDVQLGRGIQELLSMIQ
ncbi:MAG: S41 family peptidase [Candidatus Promineifilaceae bacterium]